MPITNISHDELTRMLAENPELQLVDVRTPQEFYVIGHIPQAKLMPLSDFPYAFRTLEPAQDIVLTCQHGVRSLDAAYFLESQGLERIYNLTEGMSTWPGPVDRDPSALENLT